MVEQTAAATEEAKPIIVYFAAHRRNAARAKRDEDELKQLLEGHTGGSGHEEEHSSKTIKDAPGQAKCTCEKEKRPKTEAPE